MIFKLIKELPWMFAIAAIIWLIVLILFIKNSKGTSPSFFKKHRNTFIAIITALILTVVDIWFFVQYIPTHFRKAETVQTPAVSETEIANELQTSDTVKTIAPAKSKDTTTAKKTEEIKPVAKIYTTNKAGIRFFSSGSEDIEATNNNTVSALNDKTGDLRFVALIKGFHFENELMQDHFNSADYMNSDAFPKSEFKGKIADISKVDFTKDGNYPVTASGSLSIHGITQKVTATGTITVAKGKVSVKSVFKIKRLDYGITTNEIADTLEITVTAAFN